MNFQQISFLFKKDIQKNVRKGKIIKLHRFYFYSPNTSAFDFTTKDSTRKHFKVNMYTLSADLTTIMNHLTNVVFFLIQNIERKVLQIQHTGPFRQNSENTSKLLMLSFIQNGVSHYQQRYRVGSLKVLCSIFQDISLNLIKSGSHLKRS